MSKKKIEVNTEKVKTSMSYKLSEKFLSINNGILYLMAMVFSIFAGYASKMNASVYSGLSETMDGFMHKLIVVSLFATAASFAVDGTSKGAKLNSINTKFLEWFDIALKSKISDINKLKPERIHGLTNDVACMSAVIKSYAIHTVKSLIPFTVICYHIAKMNKLAAIAMFGFMAFAIVLNLCGDFLCHFDSEKAEMKAEMQGVCTSLFMSISMLKYMNAEQWAYYKLKEVQDVATPAMHSFKKLIYMLFVELVSLVPELLCMYNAIHSGDMTLALYIAFNIASVYQMMYILKEIAEQKSELDGQLNAISGLHGDDKRYEDKPAFPDKLILQNVAFYYESDEKKMKPFIFDNLTIRKGKKYRFTSASGTGKSSVFKYFAGEMVTDRQPDFRTFYVHQQACLINLVSLRDNIALGNQYVPDGDIVYLLTEMGMGEWLANLPKGLDSVIGVDVTPSGGESSRISLMRAFLHVRNYGPDPLNRVRNTSDLILMDEVTSALDKRTRWLKDDELCTEEKVIKLVESEFKGCTVCIISHEDETSTAFGFRDIVDYEVRLDVRQNGQYEEHHILSAESCNHQAVRESIQRIAK